MAAQFILNLGIAMMWVLLSDVEQFDGTVFLTGYLVGLFIVFIMRRYEFFGTKFYVVKVYAAIKLILLYIYELIVSGIMVMRHIVARDATLYPGIFRYETKLTSEWEVTLLALLLTLSPGSVVMEIEPGGKVFYVHAMDIKRYKGTLVGFLRKFEKVIMEVTR